MNNDLKNQKLNRFEVCCSKRLTLEPNWLKYSKVPIGGHQMWKNKKKYAAKSQKRFLRVKYEHQVSHICSKLLNVGWVMVMKGDRSYSWLLKQAKGTRNEKKVRQVSTFSRSHVSNAFQNDPERSKGITESPIRYLQFRANWVFLIAGNIWPVIEFFMKHLE